MAASDTLRAAAPWLILGGGVLFAIYEVFRYLDAGLRGAEDTFKYWVGEIGIELKEFYEENSRNGISGLTQEQEALIKTKEGYLQDAYETYITQLESRNLPVSEFIEIAIIGGLVTVFSVSTVKATFDYFKTKTKNTAVDLTNMYDNTLATTDLIMQAVAYEFAYAGQTGTASMIQISIGNMYNTHFLPGLNQQVATFTAQLQLLTPGTFQYIQTYNMLAATQYCISMNLIPTFNPLVALPPII